MPVRVVEGVVQHYTWGDHDFIPRLLGVAGKDQPWAELWLGTHPNGPSVLDDGTPLSALTGPLNANSPPSASATAVRPIFL